MSIFYSSITQIKPKSEAAALQTTATTQQKYMVHYQFQVICAILPILDRNALQCCWCNATVWQVQSRQPVTVCRVQVAPIEDAVLSTLSDTTTSKTCLCKASGDPVTSVPQQSRQLMSGQVRSPLCRRSSSCQRLQPLPVFLPDTEQTRHRERKEKDKRAKKKRRR